MYDVNSQQQQSLTAVGGLDLVINHQAACLYDMPEEQLLRVAQILLCEVQKRGFKFVVNDEYVVEPVELIREPEWGTGIKRT